MNLIKWAIPAKDEQPLLFTWASVDETDGDNVVNASPLFVCDTTF
jgi:hypothetical protein